MAHGRRSALAGAGALGIVLVLAGLCLRSAPPGPPQECPEIAREPNISPDYAGLVIPPNIAPLNFRILEPGQQYSVRLHADAGRALEVSSRTSSVHFPVRPWRALLAANRGRQILLDIYVKDGAQGWRRFQSLSNTVAAEEIDSYVVYRRMQPIYT
jgi:hypothetical protein